MKILEYIPREQIKPVVGDPLEAGRKCSTKEVVVSVNCHLVLVLGKMKEWVGGSRVVIKGRHHKLLGKRSVVISLDNGESVGLYPLYSIPFGNC